MFILGSAQFGFKYAGSDGNLSNLELSHMLNLAYDSGIRELDTAEIYGNAEERLGQAGCQRFKLNSKLPPNIPFNNKNIVDIVLNKIKRLRTNKLNVLFIHDVNKFINHKHSDRLYEDLQICQKEGLISKIGISIYNISEIAKFAKDYSYEVVQGPFNFFDDRLLKYSETNSNSKVLFQYRSIFLRGILIDQKLRTHLPFKERLRFFDKKVRDCGFDNGISFSLAYAKKMLKSSKYILGVRNLNDLKELIKLEKKISTKNKLKRNIFVESDYELVNPYLWRFK